MARVSRDRRAARLLAASCVCAATVIGGVASPAVAKEPRFTRADHVEALVPVVEDEFVSDGLASTPTTYECVADRYVDGFSLSALRKVGTPSVVARERSRQRFDFERFGVTRAQEATIVATAIYGCLPISEILALGLDAEGVSLSTPSKACLDEAFAADPSAAEAFSDAALRDLTGRSRKMTSGLLRAGQILGECLTPEELQAVA